MGVYFPGRTGAYDFPLQSDSPDDAGGIVGEKGKPPVFSMTFPGSRNRMRRQGVEDINGKMPLFAQPPKKPRRKLSKAEL